MIEPDDRVQNEVQDQPVSRRGFLKYGLLGFSGLATAVGVVTPIVAYLWPPKVGASGSGDRVAVGSTKDLAPGSG